MTYTIREVVGVFDDEKALDAAVYALQTRGFDLAEFSLLASEDAVEKKLGYRYKRVKDVEDLPDVPRGTFFSRISRLEEESLPAPVLASIGALVSAGVSSVPTVVAAVGAGAALGAVLGRITICAMWCGFRNSSRGAD